MSTATADIIERIAPGVYDDMSAELYHSIRAVSATGLKTFVRKTPAHAKALLDGRYPEETSAMARGTALHAALLEPGAFELRYAVGPEVNRNTKEWKAFAAECETRNVEPMKPSESADVLGMRDALWSDPSIRKLLLACERRELSVFWTGPHGLFCKARLDLYSSRFSTVLDVKTTGEADPDRFAATAYRLGYHIQLAWYAKAIREAGLAATRTGILASEAKCPWLGCIFQPDADLLAAGNDEINKALPAWAACVESGRWPGWMSDGRPLTLSLPKWADERNGDGQ